MMSNSNFVRFGLIVFFLLRNNERIYGSRGGSIDYSSSSTTNFSSASPTSKSFTRTTNHDKMHNDNLTMVPESTLLSECLPKNTAGGGRKLPVTSEISFSKFGRQWYVKESYGEDWAPGPCKWTASPNHVYTDDQGIHLTVAPANPPSCSPFISTEVWDTTARGYGNYLFQITGPFLHMDPQVTFGLFTFDEDAPEEIYREIDFEIGKWGNKNDDSQIQFVVQPYTIEGNLKRAAIDKCTKYGGEYGTEGSGGCTDPGPNSFNGGQFEKLSLLMQWFGGPPTKLIRFYVFDGHIPLNGILQAKNALLTAWEFPYADRIPNAGNERIHFNLWQCNWGGSPDYGRRVHVIINNYYFSSEWIDLPAAGMYVPRFLQTKYRNDEESLTKDKANDTNNSVNRDSGSSTVPLGGLSPSHAHSPVESMNVPQSSSIMRTEGKKSEDTYAAVAYTGHSGHNEDTNNNVILDKGRGLSYEAGQPSGHPGGFVRQNYKYTAATIQASPTIFVKPSRSGIPTGTFNETVFLPKYNHGIASSTVSVGTDRTTPVRRLQQQPVYPHSGSGAVPGTKINIPPTVPPVQSPPIVVPSSTPSGTVQPPSPTVVPTVEPSVLEKKDDDNNENNTSNTNTSNLPPFGPEDDPTVIAPGPGSSNVLPSTTGTSNTINRPLIVGVTVAASFFVAMVVVVAAVVVGRRQRKRLQEQRQKEQVVAYTDNVFRNRPSRSNPYRSNTTNSSSSSSRSGINPFTSILQSQRENSSERDGGYTTGRGGKLPHYPSTHIRRRSQSIDNNNTTSGSKGTGSSVAPNVPPQRRVLHPPSAFSIEVNNTPDNGK